MCGIFGCYHGSDIQITKLRDARDLLYHRGPDQAGEVVGENYYHSHRRLSINDLSESGKQPLCSEDGMVSVAINGEIYNWRSLRRELENYYVFKSSSDSEVVLAAYMVWGMEVLLDRIEGMYAFSLIDMSTRNIYLARDRVGIKPLYYSNHNNSFAWASELKSLVYLYEFTTDQYDNTAIFDYLNYGYIPEPKTLYNNISCLEPGHFINVSIDDLSFDKSAYWSLNTLQTEYSDDHVATEVKRLLSASVDLQTKTDVGYSYFLSGGIDSTVITFLGSKVDKSNKAYCLRVLDPNKDESSYARLVSETLGVDISVQDFGTKNLDHLQSEFSAWFDQPFGDTSAFPTFEVSKLARLAGEKVVLTGDGGDEVFCGYTRYEKFVEISKKIKIPKKIGLILNKFTSKRNIIGKICRYIERNHLLKDEALYMSLMGGLAFNEKKLWRLKLGIDKNYDDLWYFKKYYRKELPPLKRLMFLDFHTYLPSDILTKVDRVSMKNSIECRVPLLDTSLINIMFSLSEDQLVKPWGLKSQLKNIIVNDLPREIIDKPKRGFSIPISKWIKSHSHLRTKWERLLSIHWGIDR